MERITAKEVISMMEATAQVYEQQEVISESEVGFKNGGGNAAMQRYIKNGMSPTQARMRVETDGAKYTLQQRARERETARINKDRAIYDAGGGGERVRQRVEYRKNNPEKSTPIDPNPSSDDKLNAQFNTRVQGKAALTKLGGGDLDKGIEIFRKQQAAAKAKAAAEAAAKAKAASEADADNGGGGGGNSDNTPTPTPKPTSTPKPTPTPKPTKTFKVGDTQMSKAEIKTEYDRLRTSNPTAAREFGKKAFSATNNKPTIGTTAGGTKFERRTPTSAELRAAQAARAAGKGETGAIKAGVQQAQRQASVNASIKSANTPERLNKQAPTGSALRAQQDRLAQKNKIQREVAAVKSGMPANTQSSVNNTVKSGASSVRNPMKNQMTVSDNVTGSSNTYKPGQKLSGSDTDLARKMQSQIRSGSNKVPTGDTIKTEVNPDSSMGVTQKRNPETTTKVKKALKLF